MGCALPPGLQKKDLTKVLLHSSPLVVLKGLKLLCSVLRRRGASTTTLRSPAVPHPRLVGRRCAISLGHAVAADDTARTPLRPTHRMIESVPPRQQCPPTPRQARPEKFPIVAADFSCLRELVRGDVHVRAPDREAPPPPPGVQRGLRAPAGAAGSAIEERVDRPDKWEGEEISPGSGRTAPEEECVGAGERRMSGIALFFFSSRRIE